MTEEAVMPAASARKLRILFYVEGLDIGGANQSTVATALALRQRGHTVYYASMDGPLREALKKGGVPHLPVQTHVEHPSLSVAWQLNRILRRERIDVACPNGWDCFMDALLASLPLGVPVVPTFPAIYPDYYHPRVPRAIVYSGEYRQALIERYHWNPDSLLLFINRIDTDRFRPGGDGSVYRKEWGVGESVPVALMACRFDALKLDGLSFLLDAVPALAKRIPDVAVVLAGDGEHSSRIARRVAEINEALGGQRIVLAGKVLEMERALAAADVVVGNGARSALEGFACGKPVVSVGPSGLAGVFTPESIDDFAYYNFDKGRVFDSSTRRDPEELARTLEKLLQDESLRLRLSEFGREYSIRRLSVRAGMERLEEIYGGARRRARWQLVGDGVEFLRGFASHTLFRARAKLRRILRLGAGSGAREGSGKKGQSFLADSSRTLATQVFALGLSVIQAAVVARVLKPEGKGALASALLIPQLLGSLVPLGINWSATYHLGRRTYDRSILSRALLTALIFLGGTGISLAVVGGVVFGNKILGGVPAWAFTLALLTIPTQLALLFLSALFRGEMRIAEANRQDLSRSVLMFLCILFLLLVVRLGVVGVVLGQVSAEALVIYLSLRRLGTVPVRPLLEWSVLRKLMGFGLQFYTYGVLVFLNYRFDLFLVRSMLDLRETGLYSSAVSLAEMLWMVPASLGFVLFPSIARAKGRERDALTLAVCRNSFWLMLLLCGALGAGRNLIISIFFGGKFLPAAPALLAILPGILVMSIQQVLGADLGGRGRPLWMTLGAVLGFGMNVVLNLLWIPRYGIVGASLASSVSYGIVALVVVVAFLWISGSRVRDAFLLRKEDWIRFAGLWGRLKEAIA